MVENTQEISSYVPESTISGSQRLVVARINKKFQEDWGPMACPLPLRFFFLKLMWLIP
jgi:hypothetical protein